MMNSIRFSILIFTLAITASICQGQKLSSHEYARQQNPKNFFELQDAMNEYYAQNPGIKGENPWRRKEWFYEQRLYPSGEFINIAGHTQKVYKRFRENYESGPYSLPGDLRSTHGGWLFLGPLDWTPGFGANSHQGRVNCIDFHPTDSMILYIGTPNGGIWKSNTGGTSWQNISPDLPLLSVTDLEVDHTNPNIIYALTGDGDPSRNEESNHGQTEVTSTGVIITTDGGATWYPTQFSFDHPSEYVPHKLLMHPVDPLIQFACFEDGLYRTTDGWATHEQKIFAWAYDMEFHPTNPNIVYACGLFQFWRSFDAGESWDFISDPDFSILFPSNDRLDIAVTPHIPNLVYLAGAGWDTVSRGALFVSLDSGGDNTWVVVDTVTDLIGPQALYDMALVVQPDNFNVLLAGGINVLRSASGGVPGSWVPTGDPAPFHFDVHELRYNNGTLYAVTDGGVHKSLDNGQTWIDLSEGLAITEIYRISGTPQNTQKYIIGAQDVGHKLRDGNTTNFEQIGCCDGMVSIINYLNEDEIYIAGQYGGVNKSTNGGDSFIPTNNPGDNGAWITPYIMDPLDPDILFVGKDSIHRTFNSGNTWQYINSPTIPFENLNVMTQGRNDRNKMYVSASSKIWRTDNALDIFNPVAWTDIRPGLPTLFITDIAVDPGDANIVYVTLSGYSNGNKVYKNDTGNAWDWENISGSLPNVPANCIEYHDNGQDGLYIGTDIGVFYKDNTLPDWIYFSNFLPSVNVSDLYLNPTNNTIAVGTYGRGLWLSATYSACNANINLTPSNPDGGTLYYAASNSITSTNAYDFDLGTEIHYKAGSYIDMKPGFRVGGLGFYEGKIGGCPNDISEPLTEGIVPRGTFVFKSYHMKDQTPD